MFERFKEYVRYGAGRAPGTMWAMERSYFEHMYKYPDRSEYAYIRLALQSRYPLRTDVPAIAERCSGLDDAILAAVELDFGREAAIRFRTALQSFPPCTQCGEFRSLSLRDSLCYGCRTYGRLLVCNVCRLYWDWDAPSCKKCGGKLTPMFARVDSATSETTDSSTPGSHKGNEVRVTSNLNRKPAPRFDFSKEEVEIFSVTFILLGRWREITPTTITDKQVADLIFEITRSTTLKTSDDKVAVQSFFAPLQMLLMARRTTDFCSIQEEPAFSRYGQENFLRLCDAFRREGDDGFYEQWDRIFGGQRDLDIPKYPIISYVGGPGDSKDTAVLLSASDPTLMISAEYWYLAYHFGRKHEQWSTVRQALLPRDLNEGKMYDMIDIALPDGGRRSVYFDISALPY
jgi:hypothetical protein